MTSPVCFLVERVVGCWKKYEMASLGGDREGAAQYKIKDQTLLDRVTQVATGSTS